MSYYLNRVTVDPNNPQSSTKVLTDWIRTCRSIDQWQDTELMAAYELLKSIRAGTPWCTKSYYPWSESAPSAGVIVSSVLCRSGTETAQERWGELQRSFSGLVIKGAAGDAQAAIAACKIYHEHPNINAAVG